MKLVRRSHVCLVCALLLATYLGGAPRTAGLPADYKSATGGKQAELGEQFKLLPGESSSIKDTELSLKLTRVLRSWYAKGKSESVDVQFVSTLDGKEQQHSFRLGRQSKVTVGAYQVELVRANPFGRNDCDFRVTRVP